MAGLVVVLCASAGWGAAAQQHDPAIVRTVAVEVGEPATLTVWNRPIVTLRATIARRTPHVRVSEIGQRIQDLSAGLLTGEITVSPAIEGQISGFWISVAGRPIMALLPEDLDPEAGVPLEKLALEVAQRLGGALQARSKQQRIPLLIHGIALTVAATAAFALAIWAIFALRARALRRAATSAEARPLVIRGINIRPYFRSIEHSAIKVTALGCALVAADVWLTFAFLQFPYTEPWGDGLTDWIVGLLAQLGGGALNAIPGFLTVAVIFLLTRLVAKGVNTFLRRVEMGWMRVSWLEAETARATRRIAVVFIWIFALTVAYPYIPGSGSDAFKGVSVVLGLMISLGSAGFVNQVMSGLVIVYSRSFKPGEYVAVGTCEGTITEVGVLSTKMVTPTQHEITFPNAVLVSSQVTNFSRLNDASNGSIVGATVTIGYDTPWRQVHAMLMLAAERTTGVRSEPAPRVLQRALGDFYVEYELLVSTDRPESRQAMRSELHGHILDVFNEFGVQIMSPHFQRQPEQPVTVPPSAWYAAPAVPPTNATDPGPPAADHSGTAASRP